MFTSCLCILPGIVIGEHQVLGQSSPHVVIKGSIPWIGHWKTLRLPEATRENCSVFFFSKLRRLWNAVENAGQAGSSLERGIFQFSHGFFAISHGFGANPFQSQGSQGSQELRTQLIAHNGSVQKLDLPEDMKAPLCLHRCVWSKGRRVAPTYDDGHKGVNWPWRMTRKHWVWRYEAETVGGLSPFFSSVLLHNLYIYIYLYT